MMKMMKSEKRLCVCCMEEHEVKTVLVQEHASFKNEQISYEAMYYIAIRRKNCMQTKKC